MCLDPLAASINHSCDPNSFIIFDGPRMSVRSRRQIKKGEEVTISYIDSSEPFQRRQSDLKERYFFTCNCSKCQLGSTLREDRFLPGNGDEPNLRAIENKSFALVQESKKTEDIGLAIAMLQEAEKLLKEDSRGRWPIDRQPWPELLVELHLKLLLAGEFMQAFPYALKMYFDTDPLLYPEPWHPQRVVRNASLSQLVVQLSVMAEDDATLSRVLKGYKLDMGLIVWALMNELRANVVKSHGAESQFAKMIQLKREQLGIDLTRVPAEAANHTKGAQWLEREWTNLRQFVSAANDSPQS
ncbi:MAG: hypothetical protein M1825_002359 [Sarcosagium campestre]|nr:MAG: hypothetical protein M1825_002359 [Sarcosagium campestre]